MLAAVYALFAHARIGGEANALLATPFAGIPLGTSALASAGLGVEPLVVAVVVLGLLAIVIEVRRRADLRFPGPPVPLDPALPGTAGMTATMRVLPFVTVVFAGIAPLAAALYLLSSAAWTLLERVALRRLLGRPPSRGTAPA